MNKIFKVIWNPATGNFTVASETAKGRGKKSGRRKLLVSALVAGGLMSSFGASASVSLDGGTYSDGTEISDRWIAIGQGAKASSASGGSASIAIGVNALSDAGATAVGFQSSATGQSSVALGQLSTAAGSRGVAIGSGASAAGDYSLALGRAALGNGTGSIAMGEKSEANGLYSLAFGANSIANADNTVAFGYGASATKTGAMAFGQAGKADGLNSIALGNKSQASSEDSIAIGQESYSSSEKSIAIGSLSNVTGVNSVALGTESTAAEDNTVSVGNDTQQRKIVHMAKGDISSTSTDAINGSQLYDISKSVADRLGGGASVSTAGVVNAPSYKLQSGSFNNVGDALKGIDDNTLQWDSLKNVYSAAHGSNATSTITNVKAGALSASSTDAVNGSQLFETNQNVAQNTTDIATNTTNIATNTTDIATNTGNIATNTTDIATNTSNIATNTTNITNLNTSVSDLSTTVTDLTNDALLWDATAGAFSAGHGANTTSKITNVAAGTLSADSTDVVNGSQLFETNQNVTQNTTDIATNATNIATNTTDIATNTTNIATNTTDIATNTGNIATNTTDIATNTSNIATNTTNITNLNTSVSDLSTTVTDLTNDALLWDSTAGAFSAGHGANAASKITNVAAGTLSADSTDAVNGSQLFETNQNVAQNTTDIATNTTNIATNTTDIANLNTSVSDINTTVTDLTNDALLWDAAAGAFSASHGTNTTNKITNVAAGTLSADSTDAVNGSQLYETNQNVAQNTTNITTNTTDIAELNTSISDMSTTITGLSDDALLWDATSGAFSASHGANATSKIINVAAGTLSADSTDAVNGAQLYETNQNVAQNTTDIEEINTSITNLSGDALKWDDTAEAFSASHGTNATNKITNVAAGTLSADSTDAVNGAQLYETNQLIALNSEVINNLAGDTSDTYITNNGTGMKYVRTNDTGLTEDDAHASGIGATAVGYNAVASGASSLALGQNSQSIVDTGIALGSGSVSNRIVSSDKQATSVTSDGVVIGYDTTDRTLLGALSLGTDGESYRQITNVADGSEAQDAVTVRQLQNAISAVSTTPTQYFHANSDEEDALAVGANSIAVGPKTVVNGDTGVGIGYGATVAQTASNGIAFGTNAQANHADSVALGSNSQTTVGAQSSYTAYNLDTAQSSSGEVSVGSASGQRQITNVAAGTQDTDAVNVAQLKATDSRVAANTESITNLNTQVSSLDTRVTNIENSVGDIVTTGNTKYFKTSSTGDDANAQGADSVAIGSGSIASADNSVALGTNSVADEANTVSVGSSTQQRRITNVAAGVNNTDAVNVAQLKASEAGSVRYETNSDGSINYSTLNLGDGSGGTTRIGNVSAAVNDTDAVNYAQLKKSVEEANTYTDQKMGEMNSKIKGVENKMSGGIASAMAMAGLPQAYAPGANMTSIAGGTFNGESAIALGVSMVSESGGWVYKLQGTSNSQGDYSAAIGMGFQW
ncbi:YadA-like family protein [Citrobacter sp. Awk 2]|uniref:YadA-like family protein n=1 Tax=Citrobacter sp. Awk 2 TaxID=2963959 RepID=UPI002303E7DD|nr:YadA-like family protein [Citrobacter sp. Awk 2]MDA8502839.1 YadA-like family protein [Citrobacter sp. Awk 2]